MKKHPQRSTLCTNQCFHLDKVLPPPGPKNCPKRTIGTSSSEKFEFSHGCGGTSSDSSCILLRWRVKIQVLFQATLAREQGYEMAILFQILTAQDAQGRLATF